MSYRDDADLEFLKDCDNGDLDVLVTYLTKGKNGELRWTETLTVDPEYKKYHPNHTKYWKQIAAELQTFAGNSFANILRIGDGIFYKEILINVCKKMKVNFNPKSSVELIEMNLLMKILTDSLDKMTPEQLEEVVKATGINIKTLAPEAIAATLQIAAKMSGFAIYKIAVIVANAVAKTVIGRGLSLAAGAALTRTIGILIGPIGWVITGVWTLIDIAGPAYRATIPSVIQIAYMRAKKGAKE